MKMLRAVLAASALLCAVPASAQMACTTDGLAGALQRLKEGYGEVPAFATRPSEDRLPLVITVAPGGGFTVLMIRPDGQACPVFTGEGWRAIGPGKPTPGGDVPAAPAKPGEDA